MKKHNYLLLLLLLFTFMVFGNKLNISLSKNSLDLNVMDSIIYKFYLPSGAHTNIKFVNIYGGEEIVVEENHPRSKGWHEIVVHSDSILGTNPSSGLYYLDFTATKNASPVIYYNSFQGPWGEYVEPKDLLFDQQTGQISYYLSKFSLVRTRIGMKDGGLFRSINWQPQLQGTQTVTWEKLDQSGVQNVLDIINPVIQVKAYGLPATVFHLDNSQNPINFNTESYYPENWQKFALTASAKFPIGDSFDTNLEFEIELQKKDAFTITINQNQTNRDNLERIISADNEIYISVDGEFFIETYGIEVYKPLTMSIPELPPGPHTFIVNLIFEGTNMAIGLKKVIVQ